jgi:hypothetical protein
MHITWFKTRFNSFLSFHINKTFIFYYKLISINHRHIMYHIHIDHIKTKQTNKYFTNLHIMVIFFLKK